MVGGLELVTGPDGNWTIRPQDLRLSPPAVAGREETVQWYLPYATVHPQVVEAAPRSTVWVDVSPSPNAYYGALHEMWGRGESFAVLEHDVICRPDVVEAFEECPEPWCLYPYDFCHWDCREGWRNMLGCTRFRAELLAAVPDAVSSIPEDNWDWHNVCDGLGNNLRAAGFSHHWHEPEVLHHPWTEVHP